MKFFILPFLIAANNQWQIHNDINQTVPEVTYNVTYNAKFHSSDRVLSSAEDDGNPHTINYHSTYQMVCQYDTPIHLYCHQQNNDLNVTYYFYDSDNDFSRVYNQAAIISHFGSVRFDLKLYKYGIFDIIVPEEMNNRNYDELKILVSSLSTGVNPSRAPSRPYDAIERSITGDCLTNYDVSGYTDQNIDDKVIALKGRPIIINKKRVEDYCGSRIHQAYSSKAMENSVDLEIKSSEIRMKATQNIFESTAAFIGETSLPFVVPRKANNLSFLGDLKVVYNSMVPAKNKLGNIHNPKSIGLIVGKHFL